mgnify:CR=1 FL=1|tara:strand:- start:7218 stop:8339 length:1122 start_codon:yes stop_codon:yes gene_type:complete
MKIKIFISSRNNDKLNINGVELETMTETRLYLKEELEKEEMLGQKLFDIRINEDFAADTSLDSYNTCLQEVRDSDFCIAIVNGSSGWAPPGIDFGICHSELDTAMNISEKKTAVIDVSKYYKITPMDKEEGNRNKIFKEYLTQENKFTNPLKLSASKQDLKGYRVTLLNSIKKIIFKHLSERIKIANLYYNLSTKGKTSRDWKKMKYSERNGLTIDILDNLVKSDIDFKKFTNKISCVPDNMSVSDAKAFMGRPFLKDHELISVTKKGKEMFGPIHFIGVYGNATEIQAKNLIGFPDLSVMIDDFGLYVWEQNTHIQLIFLTGCQTPSALKAKYLLFQNWSKSTKEYINIKQRAEARYHILKSILEAESIANK